MQVLCLLTAEHTTHSVKFRLQEVNLLTCSSISTAPLQIAPEEYPFSISATCPSCGDTLFGNKVLSKKVNIPVYREATLTTFTESIIAPADGIQKSINLELHNLGNAEETYLLSITQSNNKLQVYLNKEVSALLEPWDVAPDSNIKVLLPMPIGLQTGFYFVTVTAINTNDSSVRAVINLEIEVVDTAAVQVRDEISLVLHAKWPLCNHAL